MADTAISGLTDGSPAVGTDLVPVARGAANRRLSLSVVRTYVQSNLHPVAVSGSYNDLGDKPAIPSGDLDVTDFGAVGDGVADNLTAFQDAANDVSEIIIPAGTFRLSDVWTLPDKTIKIQGAGKDNTILLFTGVSGGIAFSSASSPTPEMSGFTIRSSVAAQGTALSLTSSTSSGHDDKGGDLYGIETDQTGSGYWSDHFSFNNIKNLTATSCFARNATGATLYGAGYKFRGECTDIKLIACQAVSTEYYADIADTCEGIQAYGMVGVDHRIGIKLNFATGEPGHRFYGHLNTREKGVEMTNVIQSEFSILNYAYTAQAMPGWTAYEINGANSADIEIEGLIHGTNYTGTRKGLVVNAGTRVNICATFKDVDTAREYAAGASLCTAQDCKYPGVTTEVSDAGTASTSLERRSTSSGWRMHAPNNNAIFEVIGGLSAALYLKDESGGANAKLFRLLCNDGVWSLAQLNDDGTVKKTLARWDVGAVSLGGDLNNEVLRLIPGASFVNYSKITGANTGSSPLHTVDGTDSNADYRIAAKGSGIISLESPVKFNGIYPSTMLPGNTGAQNITAFAADLAAAYAAGKSYFIPAGEYDFGYNDGTQVTIDLAVIRAVAVRGASGGRTKLKIPSGNSAIPLILTALTTATAYTPTAMATVTSGNLDNFTSLSTRSETTKLTFSGLPALATPGRMISVISNDILPYAVTAYERNFQHEISTILDVYDTNDEVFLCEKLLRTYTVANYCRAYIYDNDDIVVDIDDLTFVADGDIYDTGITASARPTFVFSILGVRHARVGPGVRFESAWVGTVRFGACLSPSYEASAKNLLNNLNGLAVLGYDPAFDGANRCPRVTFRNGENARHSPTSTWLEENQLVLNNTGFSAGSSTTFGYTSSGNDNPAINDLLYINVSGVTGTINTMPTGWYTITARSGSASSGTVTVSYDSTGDTFSSGTGTAEMFEPDQWYRYGEMMQARFDGLDSLFSYGAPFDEHENAYGTEWNDIRAIAPIEYTAGSVAPKGLSIRGACTRVNGFSLYRGTAGISINSTTQNHGVDNIIVLNDLEFRNQQDLAAAQAYITINGSASVTDKRKTIVNGLNVDGGAYRVIEHQADAGNLEVNNFNFNGDWGISGTAAAYILTHEGGVGVYNGGVIDLTAAVTNDEVRIAQLTGGTLHFRGTHFKGMSGESNYPFRIETNSGCVLIFEDCTFEWDSAATDDTMRLILVSDVTCAIHFRGTTKLINAAKLDDARGLVVIDEAGGGGTGHADIYIGEIQADGAYNIIGTATDGTYTLRDRNRKQRVHTAAGAATLAAEDDTLIINKTSGAATAVNITPGALIIGKRYTVKDGKLDAATNNITLTATAGNIIGKASASTYAMNSNGQSIELESDGTNIYLLSGFWGNVWEVE